MNILDLGPGRSWREWIQHSGDTVHCVDLLFANIENLYPEPHITLHADRINHFLEEYVGEPFDDVQAKRVFEHIPYTEILYVLYLIYTVTRLGGILNIVVPDYNMVLGEIQAAEPKMVSATTFNRTMVWCHTEIFNEPNDPHRSIWTKNLAEYYIELEGYWKLDKLEYVTIDNRSWYMDITAVKV